MAKVAPFEAHHERYERWFEEHRAAYVSELLALRALVPWEGHGLEIGVGTARFAAPLGVPVGLDPSDAMLARAAARGIEASIRRGHGRAERASRRARAPPERSIARGPGQMTTFLWILLGGLLMSAIALIGSVTLILRESTLQKLLLPLVAFAAGSLIGGALFHMLPAALTRMPALTTLRWVALGFASFFALEQFLHWHHCHRAFAECKKPLTYLILIGDGLHNFLGGLSIAGVFLMDVRLGIAAWIAAAAHEIPQELGDFGVLIHGGWEKRLALLFNLLSGLTFLAGSLVAYGLSQQLDVSWLVPLAAGNFLYIGASDLVPEVNKPHSLGVSLLHFVIFGAGLALLYALAVVGGH